MEDDRLMKRRLGVLVLMVLVILVVLVFLFADQNMQWRKDGGTVRISFHNAPGIVVGTPVSRSGIRIGRVSEVLLTREGEVLLTVHLDPGKAVFQGDEAMVNKPLMGDSEIYITRKNVMSEEEQPLQKGDTLRGIDYSDPIAFLGSIQGQVAGTLQSIEKTSDEMRQVFANVNQIVGTNRASIDEMLSQAKNTTELLHKMLANANTLLGNVDNVENIQEAIRQAPLLIAETRESMKRLSARIETSLDNADHVLATADGAIAGVDAKLSGLVRQGDVTLSRLNSSLEAADRTLADISEVTQKINNGQGTVGALVNDRELYNKLVDTVANVEYLTAKLDPIVADMRVMSDTLARHPERLGAAGLFRPTPGTKF